MAGGDKLQNLRFDPGEEADDQGICAAIAKASQADFVQDGFGWYIGRMPGTHAITLQFAACLGCWLSMNM